MIKVGTRVRVVENAPHRQGERGVVVHEFHARSQAYMVSFGTPMVTDDMGVFYAYQLEVCNE